MLAKPRELTEEEALEEEQKRWERIEDAVGYARERVSWGDIRDLEGVLALIPLRQEALADSIRRLDKIDADLQKEQLFTLAAVDVFVEKAQFVLTRRSDQLYRSGIISIFATFLLLAGGALFVGVQLTKPVDDAVADSVNALILRIFQATALSAFVLVGVKYLVSLGRSFFNEATSLRERRHALRFGRLFVYLKKGKFDLEQLQEAFQWNKVSGTSFLDVKPEVVAETLLHKVIEAFAKAPAETAKAVADIVEKAKK